MTSALHLIIAARPHWHWLFNQICFSIGHHQAGRVGQSRETSADTRNRADTGRDDLPICAECFGTRKNAEFSKCNISHQYIASGLFMTASFPPTESR